ncbi:MAG: FecR domain-containing protein [Pedobacter sp.]|nr:FecR domain-containing protein [Pedobacter sp.]MDQ8051560.1 FecR domain-containing protein [Pedobacter sp.]
MTKEEFIRIAEKVGDGSASSSELALYNQFFNQYQQHYPVWNEQTAMEKESIKEELGARIAAQLHAQQATTPTRRLWARIAAAASVLIILSLGIYFHQRTTSGQYTTYVAKPDFSPGKNKAYLTLANGKRINLDDAKQLHLTLQEGITVTKAADGHLVYQVAQHAAAGNGTNTIETPLGGQYQVQLPDGTNVWLNAASAIKYPLKFSGKKRIVEITGEAYFEVAHNAAMPFVVKTIKQEIEVLGTHFNVMAYGDEPEVQTTLVQGSVKITSAHNALVLRPGQQAKVVQNSVALNLDADIESAIAWKSGKIQFTDMNIQNIMRMLSRWYDFEAEYETKQLNITFGGSFSRNKNLSAILKSLESTGDVHFKLSQGDAQGKGRRVVVMP